jgi:hypothetical protein
MCCTEFACALVGLANLLGCDTVRAVMQSDSNCTPFKSLEIHALGHAVPRVFDFCHHQTCVIRGDALGPDSLAFDPPFLLDMPLGGPAPAWKPVDGIPLGTSTSEAHERVYLRHLISEGHIATVQTFEVAQPLLKATENPPDAGCIAIQTTQITADLMAAFLPPQPMASTPSLDDLQVLDPVMLPPRLFPVEAARERTFFTKGGEQKPAVQVDVWRSEDQAELARFVARYVASREVKYIREDVDGVPTFVSSSGNATIQLRQGSVVRLIRLSDEAPPAPKLAKDAARLGPA